MQTTSPTPAAATLLDHRIVFLGEEVNDDSANRVITQLFALAADDRESDICLFINSPGGSVNAGLAIYDTMQLIPNDVVTVAIGLAASMGQVLLCAGTSGKRVALPHAQVLMHEGSAGLGGVVADVEIQAANLAATLDRLRSVIALHTGHDIDEVTADVGRDRWFDAHEALAYGFIDHIAMTVDDLIPPRTTRRIGLTAGGAT